MPLPSSLRWFDVDLPGILEYKHQALRDETPACVYGAVKIDLRDPAKRQALFAQIGGQSQRALVVTEGLLIYLTAEQVGALARDLHRPASFKWWLFDLASPELLKYMLKSWGKSVAAGNAPFQFAPADSTRFFESFGWREVEFRSTTDEARRLRREMRTMWLYRLLGAFASAKRREAFRRFSGYALLERT
jgi:O-methyltransferase involved in polyketide biosynthesis